MLDNIGGILLTGGRINLLKHSEQAAEEDKEENLEESTKESPKTQFAKKVIWLIQEIERRHQKKNDPLPVWGTCLGFEGLMLKEAEEEFDFDKVDNQNVANKIKFLNIEPELKGFFDDDTLEFMQKEPIFFFNHKNAISVEKFENDKSLQDNFEVLATSTLRDSETPIVAFVKHREMPFYGVQFHPEKNEFEMKAEVDHTEKSIDVMKRFADFFLSKVKALPKEKEEFFKSFLQDYALIDLDKFEGSD